MCHEHLGCCCKSHKEPPNYLLRNVIIFLGVILTLLFILLGTKGSQGSSGVISEHPELVGCIIGEAVGEGYIGMKGVAFVYRNRLAKGMDLGCKALERKDLEAFVEKEGNIVKAEALKILYDVFVLKTEDITEGATHYANLNEEVPYWVPYMTKTVDIGNHTYFKE